MENIFEVNDVFTPSSPARLTFIERELINRRIVRALKTKGTQIIVYGPSGSGKTTLLENKLFQTYEQHIKTSCMKGMTFEAVLMDAFDQLRIFFLEEGSSTRTKTIDASIKSNFQVIDTQLKMSESDVSSNKSKRLLPPQLTAQNLARFMGEAGYCWILDDFHKVKKDDKEELSQLMKVFMDMSIHYPELKVVCVGAVNTARQVVQYDHEMKERVAEIKVPLMEEAEITEIIRKGFSLLNVEIAYEAIYSDIYHYSNGLASICHKLCQLICEGMDIEQTLDLTAKNKNTMWIQPVEKIDEAFSVDYFDDLDSDVVEQKVANERNNLTGCSQMTGEKVTFEYLTYAVQEYLDSTSDTIKQAFDKAFQITNASIILEALSECGEEGESIDDLIQLANSMDLVIEPEGLKSLLGKLVCESGGSILTHNTDSHLYNFSSPFLMTFARNLFEHGDYRQKMSKGELFNMMNSAFNSLKKSVGSSR